MNHGVRASGLVYSVTETADYQGAFLQGAVRVRVAGYRCIRMGDDADSNGSRSAETGTARGRFLPKILKNPN